MTRFNRLFQPMVGVGATNQQRDCGQADPHTSLTG